MTYLHISSPNVRYKPLSLFPAKVAQEQPLHVPIEVAAIPKKRKRPELRSWLDVLVFWHSSHLPIIAEMGYRRAGYNQPERKMAALENAYEQAGGQFA